VGNSTPAPSKTPNRSSPEFAWVITSWTLPLCKISSRYNYPLLPPNIRKCASSDSCFLVLPLAYGRDPYTDFYIQYTKWCLFAQGYAFWGSRKQNFIFWPHFLPKRKFWANFWRLKKSLTMGMLTCKLPLIIIVAPWKLYEILTSALNTAPATKLTLKAMCHLTTEIHRQNSLREFCLYINQTECSVTKIRLYLFCCDTSYLLNTYVNNMSSSASKKSCAT